MNHGSAQSQGEHHAVLFLEDVQHVRKLAWIWGYRDTVVHMGGSGSDGDLWKNAIRLFEGGFGMG